MTEIKLYNTKTKTKEVFTPLDKDNVRMYVCGPTVYDRAHIGNARPVVVFDVLFRLLRYVYGEDHVTYARNFTDVDDKINAKAEQTGRSIRDITDETIQWFLDDMGALGALQPTVAPRATEYIPQMIAMIEELIAKGHAYEAEGHALFDVNSYKNYGALSGRSVDDMIAGARVEVAPYKRNPMDFVLWKPSTGDQPGWDSPWGYGRPGWHIECSAMSRALFGDTFDIHGGGLDLQFPHHENEIAQSCACCGEDTFAKVWMHNEMLQVEGKKMSKSLGNFFSVRELIEKYENEFQIENFGPAIRLRFLQTHYRSPIDFSHYSLEQAATKLHTWSHMLDSCDAQESTSDEADQLISGTKFITAIADDLNTPDAISYIDQLVKELKAPMPNHTYGTEYLDNIGNKGKLLRCAVDFLGFDIDEIRRNRPDVRAKNRKAAVTSDNGSIQSLIEKLLVERDKARSGRDFNRADQIRDIFSDAGVVVTDTPEGADWQLAPNFDPSKLEALK